MRVISSIFVCLLIGAAGVAESQPSNGATRAPNTLCGAVSGAAADLCNDYCATMACHLANDGDPETEPNASAKDCEKARVRFNSSTGRDMPCEQAAACPCADPMSWSDPVAGFTWQSFALQAFNRADTTCSDDSSQTNLEENVPDFPATGAGVDVALSECRVFGGDASQPPRTMDVSASQASACRQILRRAGGSLCS